jgi:predicted nucleic acid-binding protein
VIIADTSGLLALYNQREPAHATIARVIAKSSELLVVSPYVVAELDYLAATRLGVDAELLILRELASGAYELPTLVADDLNRCASVIERYHDQVVGVTDASLVVLAHRYRTRTILTLDHRHFDVLRPIDGGRFKLVPG